MKFRFRSQSPAFGKPSAGTPAAAPRLRQAFGGPARRRLAGVTLVELMIAVVISSAVFGAVISLQLLSARTAKEVFGETRTRSARMNALDQIRYRLGNAKIGSCVASQEGHRIEFRDPNFGNVTSAFYFTLSLQTLYYDDDINGGAAARAIVRGPIDITFELQSSGELILLKVKSSSDAAYGDVDIQDGETTIYLRNG